MALVQLPCGHTINDEFKDTVCYGEAGHYPLRLPPTVYCKRCDLMHPDCDHPEPVTVCTDCGRRDSGDCSRVPCSLSPTS